jgi:phosphatidylserine/phosphatidylglycerophosphate/cardiolipin synthase-like enzyme
MKLLPLILLCPLVGCAPLPPAPSPPPVAKPPAATEDDIAVFFSPKGGAMAAIIGEINRAERSVDVNAYLITSRAIVDALEAAQGRGVQVRIVLDKNNLGGMYSASALFAKSALAVWRDGQHKDEHNKVILIDGHTIITGSFNFTDPSEEKNAENLLIIRNKPKLFAAYLADFEAHLGHSEGPKRR